MVLHLIHKDWILFTSQKSRVRKQEEGEYSSLKLFLFPSNEKCVIDWVCFRDYWNWGWSIGNCCKMVSWRVALVHHMRECIIVPNQTRGRWLISNKGIRSSVLSQRIQNRARSMSSWGGSLSCSFEWCCGLIRVPIRLEWMQARREHIITLLLSIFLHRIYT